MKIAMVSEHASPLAVVGGVDAGGQNVYVAALSAALVERGHEVSVYTRRTSIDDAERVRTAAGYEVVHVPAGPATDVPKDALLPHMRDFATFLSAQWARTPPDLVHSHFWMSGLAATDAARALALPVVHTFHALGTVKHRYQRDKDTSPQQRVTLERALTQRVARVLATCSDEVEELRRMDAPMDRVEVVPCGVDTDHFRPGHGQPHTAARVLVVGRLVERKGVDDVIRAMALLPGAELVVAGGGSARHLDADPEVVRLREVARQCGVLDRVQFIGHVAREGMPALFRASDVVATTPWYEPFGIVPLEAMACGRPVVASAVGGLLDTVVHGETGLHVPPRNPSAVAAALRVLIEDQQRRQEYGANGRRRVRERYGWDRVAEAAEQVYGRAGQPAVPAGHAARRCDAQNVGVLS